jgi:hypothetical protein
MEWQKKPRGFGGKLALNAAVETGGLIELNEKVELL